MVEFLKYRIDKSFSEFRHILKLVALSNLVFKDILQIGSKF